MSECWTCHHPVADHPADEPGDPLSCAPCTFLIRADLGFRLRCDCGDYDGTDHPDRPSLAETVVYQIDGEVGYL